MAKQFIRNFLRTILITSFAMIASVTATRALAEEHHVYTVRVDPNLETMSVSALFAEPVRSVSARSNEAGRYLSGARNCGDDSPLRIRNRRLLLPSSGLTCLEYTVDLEDAARAERRNAVLAGENFVVSPATWFWRPALRDDEKILVRFEHADSVNVFVPWLPVDGERDTYMLMASPESAMAPAAFGDFEYYEEKVPGATLRITLLQPNGQMDSAALVRWIADTARNVNLTYGTFPNPTPNIVVIPVGERSFSDSPVPFGRVVRDGGETIELFIDQRQPIEAFYDDWTATHEFSHLMLPYVRSSYRWVSEGFATYYQNVLLARAGQYTQARAWQKLYEGFERGRHSRPEMSPNEAAQRRARSSTMKIYWSGASLALMADIELRRRSDGRESLDTVLERLQACCLPSDERWSGPEFFEKLDTLIDEPVFMPLYDRYANSAGFPDYRDSFAALGVEIVRGRVRLEDDAPLGAIRSEIMSGRGQ